MRLANAVRRNLSRFPHDFMFELTHHEVRNLRCQIGTSSFSHGGHRHRQLAFTEQGIAMLSSVLNSERAIAVNTLHELMNPQQTNAIGFTVNIP